ncbi:peptidoglycan-binding domain-containing protein [Streptomyces diastatochromogenes]|nr:peptidoglycan-binding domain-containing protein [Streptomyces diastatochromogenes]
MPPWVQGNAKDLVVEYAQERLAAMRSTNPCRLTGSWSRGVIDRATRDSIACYQRAVVKDAVENGKNSGEILNTDAEGTLGRATLTSLWAQGVTPDEVKPGTSGMETTQLMAAFWWAYNRQFSDHDLDVARTNARIGIDNLRTGKVTATRYGSSVQNHIRDYQTAVGLPATGVVDGDTLKKMVGGSVM